jgi:hypothetical protein
MWRPLDALLAGGWFIFWAILARRLFRKPDLHETPAMELKRRTIMFAWPFALALGLVLLGLTVVRVIQ